MQTAAYDGAQADKVLSAWTQGSGRIVLGQDAQAGLYALAVKAEKLAAQAGFATAIPSDASNPAGEYGYIVGGAAAAAKIAAATGSDAATVYLAAQNAIRRAQAEIIPIAPAAQGASFGAAESDPYDVQPAGQGYENAIAPVAVALIVIAVVAVAAAIAVVAWSSYAKVAVEQQTQQRIALVNAALDAASSSNPNVRNNPELWKTLQTLAGTEASESAPGMGGFPWGWVLGLGAIGLGVKWWMDRNR